jgi:hypothetical protein
MPLHVKTIVEAVLGESCSVCTEEGTTYRTYFEAGEHSGYGPNVCRECLLGGCVSRQSLDDPAPQRSGAAPPTKSRRKSVQKQEREMAELIGGRTQKASGAMASAKGDVRLKGVLRGEMKSTVNASFSLKREYLTKIRSECTGRERPFLTVRFLNDRTLAPIEDWVLIPLEDWEPKK